LQENKSKGIEQTDIDAESKLISGDDLSDNAVATKKDAALTDKVKTYEELEKTRETKQNLFDEYFGFMNDLDRNDWFSVYIN
jgi:carboxyl-terminal processing protease